MNTALTLSDLPPADRTLLAQAILDGFSLPTLLSRAPNAHPAQKCILALLDWFDLPHIRAAADRYIETVQRIDEYSAKAARRPIRENLSRLFSLAFDNAAESRNAIRPENAPAAEKNKNSACREARLVMHQLVRMTIAKSARKTKPSPSTTADTNADPSTNAKSDPQTNTASLPTPTLPHAPDSASTNHTDLKSQFDSLLRSEGDLHTTSPLIASTPITSTPPSPTLSPASLLTTVGTPRGTPRQAASLPLHMNLPSAPNAALIPLHLRPDASSP